MKIILVVDDDISFLTSFSEMVSLIDSSYDVITAENGEQALAVLGSIPIDLLITDIHMPVVPGSELVLWMRENMPETPVIAMSAGVESSLVASIEGEGYSYFDKPLDVTGMAYAIRSVLTVGKEPSHAVAGGLRAAYHTKRRDS